MAKSVLVLLAKGFEEIEAVSIIDVCRRGGLNVCAAGVEELLVQGANHITVAADCLLCDVLNEKFDIVVLPGGLGGTNILASNVLVQALLKEYHNDRQRIAAICAAPFALHKAGVLGKNYTCYPSFEKQIKLEGYDPRSNVVVDENITTSRGPATAICLGLSIVAQLQGDDVAQTIKGGLLADFC